MTNYPKIYHDLPQSVDTMAGTLW